MEVVQIGRGQHDVGEEGGVQERGIHDGVGEDKAAVARHSGAGGQRSWSCCANGGHAVHGKRQESCWSRRGTSSQAEREGGSGVYQPFEFPGL